MHGMNNVKLILYQNYNVCLNVWTGMFAESLHSYISICSGIYAVGLSLLNLHLFWNLKRKCVL